LNQEKFGCVTKRPFQAKITPTKIANRPAEPKLTTLLGIPPLVLPEELPEVEGVEVGEEELDEELDEGRTGVVVRVAGLIVLVEVVVVEELLLGSDESEELEAGG